MVGKRRARKIAEPYLKGGFVMGIVQINDDGRGGAVAMGGWGDKMEKIGSLVMQKDRGG